MPLKNDPAKYAEQWLEMFCDEAMNEHGIASIDRVIAATWTCSPVGHHFLGVQSENFT